MKIRMTMLAALIAVAGSPLLAGNSISGKYVEARTAEVFTGGCIMSSEADTVGREAPRRRLDPPAVRAGVGAAPGNPP